MDLQDNEKVGESGYFGNMLTFDCQYTCCTLNMSTETIDDGKQSALLNTFLNRRAGKRILVTSWHYNWYLTVSSGAVLGSVGRSSIPANPIIASKSRTNLS